MGVTIKSSGLPEGMESKYLSAIVHSCFPSEPGTDGGRKWVGCVPGG